MDVKKSESADLKKNIKLYTLMGLALMLLISWQALEFETKEVVEIEEYVEPMGEVVEEEIPITMMLNTPPPPPPPPPPAPEIIEVVENEVEIEEVIIEDTETEEEEEIVEVDEIAEEQTVVADVIEEVPFAVIESVPVYPGCEKKKNNADRKKCMEDKIKKFIDRKFDTGLANELGLEGRQKINVQFKIDSKGNVVGVQSRAPHPRLKQEAASVIGALPKMTPGMQRGKAVTVVYSLPIIFEVHN